MRPRTWVLILGAAVALPVACKKDEQPPPQPPPTYYPPAPAPAPAPTPTAPAPVPGPTAAQPAPTGAATPAPGPLSQPSPMALPCTSDAACLTHRCNTAAGKCAWPCQTDNDCNPGNHCMAGACVPKMQ